MPLSQRTKPFLIVNLQNSNMHVHLQHKNTRRNNKKRNRFICVMYRHRRGEANLNHLNTNIANNIQKRYRTKDVVLRRTRKA